MIFSRTASSTDIKELNIQENIIDYLQHASMNCISDTTLSKFWEYSILLKLIDFYALQKSTILNIYHNYDNALDIIMNNKKLRLAQQSMVQFLNSNIKSNRYDIICCLGSLEYAVSDYVLLNKIQKHVAVGGYIVLTTNSESSLLSKRTITADNLMDYSLVLENLGYDLCSDEFNTIDYNNNSNIHSLIMKRNGAG